MARQLGEFLAGDRTAFGLPLEVRGSEFDWRVWELVAGVPYGETTTYGELAHSLGAGAEPRDVGAEPRDVGAEPRDVGAEPRDVGAEPRDVGAAVGRNPLCIIIPCHRVVGATGRPTGHAGGLDRKRALLEIEHVGALRAGCASEERLW
ncbi:MAG: methylated-DNA--[protein]-cysteine S-methyltransferase [Streptosporangiaceae bacterium]